MQIAPAWRRGWRPTTGKRPPQECFTRLDRTILRDAADGVLSLAKKPERDPIRHALRMGRLRTLERLGLASEPEPGVWRITPEMDTTLRRMGERGDIIKAMHRDLAQAGVSRNAIDYAIFDSASPGARVVGRIVAEGVADELRDRRYLIVDSIDGRAHYVDLGVHADAEATLSPGMIVEVRARGSAGRAVDRTIAAVAAEHDGVYSPTAHRARDRSASDEHITAHVRRLEALRRRGLVERTPEGEWKVGQDYVDRAARYEAHQRSRTPVGLAVLSWRPLDQLPGAEGATWLDRQLTSSSPEAVRTAGFGAEVEAALNRRRQWLLDQGLARDVDGKVAYAPEISSQQCNGENSRARARESRRRPGAIMSRRSRAKRYAALIAAALRSQVAASPSSSTRGGNSRSFPGGRRSSAPGGGASAKSSAMMRGHYAYYGITGNFRRLSWYARQVAISFSIAKRRGLGL